MAGVALVLGRSVANGLVGAMGALGANGLPSVVAWGSIALCALVAGRPLGLVVAAGSPVALRLGADADGSAAAGVPGLGATRWVFGLPLDLAVVFAVGFVCGVDSALPGAVSPLAFLA